MKILLLGPQGSGKSTLAKYLSESLNVPVISTGDIFRKIAEDSSKEGQKIAEIVRSGKLVDDETVSLIVKKRLSEEDSKNGFILDGYPRSVKQIEYYDPGFDKVIFLKIPKQVAVERLLKRGRIDDYKEAIEKRLDEYYQQIEQILEYYRKLGSVLEINAETGIEEVWQQIKEKLSI